MSAYNIDSFCIDDNEKYIYAANKSGQVLTIDVDSFEVINQCQVHLGSISVIARHQKYNYLACHANDGYASILNFDNNGKVSILHKIQTRNIKPEGDPYLRNHSTTQAIAFHHSECRLVGHGGSSALFELQFDEKGYHVLHCTRIHGNDDFVTAVYIPKTNQILSGSVSGVAILSEGTEKIKEWSFFKTGMPTIHWFEPLSPNVYAIACDGQKVIRLDIKNEANVVEGPFIVKDHMEHVTFCQQSQKLYAASFDRTVVEVDPQTCQKIKVVWRAPFKLRWIKILEKSPDVLIAQCRNGGLYKVNISTKTIISVIKNTPPALWSVDVLQDQIITSGESNFVLKAEPNFLHNCIERLPSFLLTKSDLPTDDYYYTKRLCVHQVSGKIAYGRTNGEIFIEDDVDISLLVILPDAIRDMTFGKRGEYLFVANEDGSVYRVDILGKTYEKIHGSDKPCWALAYNESQHVLAIADRTKNIYLFDLVTHEKRVIADNLGFVKRVKWQDETNLLYGSAGTLYRYCTETNETSALCTLENTIEDFDWDKEKKYLVVVDYTRYLYLCDFSSGEMLYEHGDMIDYSKGIVFIDKLRSYAGYPGDFIVVGRAGKPLYYRVHDDRIISYGFINQLEKETHHES